MRSSLDALRSLAKYAARGLGPEWEIRLAWEEGMFRRPFCRVGWAGPETSTGPAHHVDVARPFNLLCHPAEATSVTASVLDAGRVAQLLSDAFEVGVQWSEPSVPGDSASPPVTTRGRPRRVPLWNWDGVGPTETVAARFDRDYLRVTQLSTNVIDDPGDELLRAVACDLRLAWRRRGEIPAGRPWTGEVRVRQDPEAVDVQIPAGRPVQSVRVGQDPAP